MPGVSACLCLRQSSFILSGVGGWVSDADASEPEARARERVADIAGVRTTERRMRFSGRIDRPPMIKNLWEEIFHHVIN